MTIDETIRDFSDRLRAAHGDNLVSAILYGMRDRDDEPHKAFVVLARIAPDDLRAAHDAVADWVSAGNAPPVYFTAAEVADSSDVFPMEFLDMSENRRVLLGADPFEKFVVSRHNLRHQVEYELRGKLLRLRRYYIPAGTSPERLTQLLVESIVTFSRIFRFALELVGDPTPRSGREAIAATVARFVLDPAPFEEIFAAAESGRPLADARAHACFGTYIEQIERVVDAIDKIPEAEAPGTGST